MAPAGNEQPHWAAQLYDACAAELLLYGRALGLSHSEAEDVLHDAFRALLTLAQPPREPRFYLIRTFRNRSLNHRRGLWRRLTRELHSSAWFEPVAADSPVERAAIAALRNLPSEQREVIVLKLWHDLTFETVGELLEISPNTAAGRYRYGLLKLRAALKDHDHEIPEQPGDDPAWLPAASAVPDA